MLRWVNNGCFCTQSQKNYWLGAWELWQIICCPSLITIPTRVFFSIISFYYYNLFFKIHFINFFFIWFFNFVRYVDWWSSTRILRQIWLEVVEKSRIVFKPHYIEEPMILIRVNSTFFHQNMMTLGHSFWKILYISCKALFFLVPNGENFAQRKPWSQWGTKIAKNE